MPAFAGEPLRGRAEVVFVIGAVLLRGDDGDFVVKLSVLVDGDATLAVAEGVAVEPFVVSMTNLHMGQMYYLPLTSQACR